MSHRSDNRQPLIIPTIIEQKGDSWKGSGKLAAEDAQRVLEALVAEHGVEGAIIALDRQGFTGKAYRYLLGPLYEEAIRRRRGAAALGDQ